jgi:hypothetical protein
MLRRLMPVILLLALLRTLYERSAAYEDGYARGYAAGRAASDRDGVSLDDLLQDDQKEVS